jgi:DNA-binding XRE family transcriptional regulator
MRAGSVWKRNRSASTHFDLALAARAGCPTFARQAWQVASERLRQELTDIDDPPYQADGPGGGHAGALLRQARKRAGLSHAELAARAGVTQSVISAYESGRRQPSIPALAALVDAAGYELALGLRRQPRRLRRLSGPVSRPDGHAVPPTSIITFPGPRRLR